MWSELAKDAGGIALFVLWLVLPLAYVVVLGRRYVRLAREAAHEAVWANDEIQAVLEDLQDDEGPDEGDPPTVPTARTEATWELPRVQPPERAGKHRLDRSEVPSCLK
ncbi:hypothetical protein OG205_24440 [Lentzea sp. NBC_00516]|uniref:hypothetical protein n=1 Tax=Lentzea sp. NBC_00516 TaxID=2903582 RepID=UPI002E809FB4|nr:hypothetical protein [Lentzea sp. NBC_00516]WUD21290.1 hypothetical protein OG205_24440 [Lentzea sp. NBC_00516]